MELRLHLHEPIMGQGHREARETWCRGSKMQPLCPKPSSNHCSSPTVGCREGGGIFWAALLGKTSLRVLILLSAASLLPHPSAPPLTAKPDVAFLWRAEREGEVPVREQPSGCRQQGCGECQWLWQWGPGLGLSWPSLSCSSSETQVRS